MGVPLEIVATVFGMGAASGVRAGLSLLLVAVAGRVGLVSFPDSLAFLTSAAGLGALSAATVFEELLERDDDAQQLVAMIRYGTHGSGALLVHWVLLQKLHLALGAVPLAMLGAALAVATHHLRMQVHEALLDLELELVSPRRWWVWLETGGVIGVAAATVLAPALVVVLLVAAGGVGWSLHRAMRAMEAASRRPCPACRHLIRPEAMLCPKCRATVPVAKRL